MKRSCNKNGLYQSAVRAGVSVGTDAIGITTTNALPLRRTALRVQLYTAIDLVPPRTPLLGAAQHPVLPWRTAKLLLEVISLILRQKLQQQAAVGKSLLGRSGTAGATWVISVVPGLGHGPHGSSHSVLWLSLPTEELHHERL